MASLDNVRSCSPLLPLLKQSKRKHIFSMECDSLVAHNFPVLIHLSFKNILESTLLFGERFYLYNPHHLLNKIDSVTSLTLAIKQKSQKLRPFGFRFGKCSFSLISKNNYREASPLFYLRYFLFNFTRHCHKTCCSWPEVTEFLGDVKLVSDFLDP